MSSAQSATNFNRTGRSSARPMTAKTMRPASSTKSFQLDLKKFSGQLEGPNKPVIRPKKQLNTEFFHSVLYKMKMQKDVLEDKIK